MAQFIKIITAKVNIANISYYERDENNDLLITLVNPIDNWVNSLGVYRTVSERFTVSGDEADRIEKVLDGFLLGT